MSFRSKPSRLACLGGVEGDRPMSISVGIGGWTYEPWRGTFYPPGHPQKRELDYAGRQLTGIEINGAYYGSQKPETFANWAASVPDGFRRSEEHTSELQSLMRISYAVF